MRARRAALLAILAGTGFCGGAQAQSMYRCPGPGGTGNNVISDRPCVGVPSKLGAYGPASSSSVRAPAFSSHTPTTNRAPDFLPHLSPACAQLNDAIRTGPSRGLRSATMRDLHDEYQDKCADDEQAARQRLADQRSEGRKERHKQQAALLASQAQASHAASQCEEMLRILQSKRKRYDTLSDGRKDDLRLFESSYRERCGRG